MMRCLFSRAILLAANVWACTPSTAPPQPVPLAPLVHGPSPGPYEQDIDELGTEHRATTTDPVADRSPVMVEGEEVRFQGGDGTSQSAAIVILGARGRTASRLAENALLFRAFGKDIRFLAQERIETGGRTLEVITFERANGRRPAVWFDVTDSVQK